MKASVLFFLIVAVLLASNWLTWQMTQTHYFNLGVDMTIDEAVRIVEEGNNTEDLLEQGYTAGVNAAATQLKQLCDTNTLFKVSKDDDVIYVCLNPEQLKPQTYKQKNKMSVNYSLP